MGLNIKGRIRQYRRVLKVSRKPSKEEFLTSSKISALGMLVIGAIGFVIFIGFILLGI